MKMIKEVKEINFMDNSVVNNLYVRGLGTLEISLSNDFIEILNAYIKQTGNSVCFIEEIKWKSNNKLSKSIKGIMNDYNVNYSIVYYMEGKKRTVLINKRATNNWYSLLYQVKPSEKERTQYFKKKYPLSFYFGYIKGFISYFLALSIYKLFGIKIVPEKYINY
jgi:hypothetical protein